MPRLNKSAGKTHVGDIRGRETDVSHDGDHHMLLHVEMSGVKAPGVPECIEFAGWEDLLQEFTGREGARYQYPLVVFQMGVRAGETDSSWATLAPTLIPG